jgi:hypothetical protein
MRFQLRIEIALYGLGSPFDGFYQFFGVYGLEQVVNGTEPEGLDGIFLPGGYENDFKVNVFEAVEQIEARAIAHFDIEQHKVGPFLPYLLFSFFNAAGLADHLHQGAKTYQQALQSLADMRFIVDDEGTQHFLGDISAKDRH